MAARSIEVAEVEPGEPSWTDGATAYLDDTRSPADQVRALAVQSSLLAAGSLDPEILGRLGTRRGVARRYLALEGHRALCMNEAFLPRVALSMIDRASAGSVDSAEASLGLALGRGPVPDPPADFGVLRVRRAMDAIERTAAGTGGTGPPPRGVPDVLPEIEDEGDGDDGDDDAGHLGQLLSSPVGGGGSIGRLLKRLLSSTRQRGSDGPPGADAATHVGRARSRGTEGAVSTRALAVHDNDEPDGVPTPLTYPEWDVHRRRYRSDWCTVVESDPGPEALVSMPMPDGIAFRGPLSRLGTGLVACRRRPQGDDIDIDAAVQARVDALAGSPVDEDCYVETVRQRRDLSVQILLDVSGSSNEAGPAGRPVHEYQRVVAGSLTSALHDLGDRVALHAFNSQGRSSVRMIRVKSFDDPVDSIVAQRLGGLVPGAYTRLGAAIRHGASQVEHGGTSKRLLVVISDGFAYDHGYEGGYGEADARRALTEARRSGVGCLCLSVGAGVEAADLRRVFGTAAHASVGTPDQLTSLIGPLFRAALRSADARRRVFQRKERTRERLELERSAT